MGDVQCSVVIIDNFYNNPYEVRNFALSLDFNVSGNYPGKRTKSTAMLGTRNMIQKFIPETITDFNLSENDNYNGSFQYTTSQDRSWIHKDPNTSWAGVLYLTPDAPVTGGTGIFKPKKGGGIDPYDMTQWELVDRIGNVFNRMVIFNSQQFHISMDYFGTNKENGRLFQTFFFNTE